MPGRHPVAALAYRLFNTQAYNKVGTGTIDGKSVVGPDPTPTYVVPARDERSTELSINDAMLSHEGRRSVFADESIRQPAWTRFDAALRYEHKVSGANVAWTLGVDNLTAHRYWKESPFPFGLVYLYPGAPRTLRLTMNASL